MKYKFLYFVLCFSLLCAAVPSRAIRCDGETTLDFDGSNGYRGDYVLIYNSNETGSSKRTGNLTDLIETDIDEKFILNSANAPVNDSFNLNMRLSEPLHTDIVLKKAEPKKSDPYTLGFTKQFEIYEYNLGIYVLMDMKVTAVGEHCYVWEAVDPERYPLSDIVPGAADTMVEEFESKYSLMQESFGDFYDPQGHGRLNLLFYDIHDGWTEDTPGGFIGGFFDAMDMQNSNKCATVHLDTYPTIYYEDENGNPSTRFNREYCGGILMHEFQHCINYSNCGYTPSWINESMSAAAEEITYPGSSIVGRLLQWENDEFDWIMRDDGKQVLATKREFRAESKTQTGASLYKMLDGAETGYGYAQVSMLAQYLYSQNDNSIFRRMTENMANGIKAMDAIPMSITGGTLYGKTMSEIGFCFRLACATNDYLSYDGITGFNSQDGFDSEKYYNLESPYSLLSPGVYTTGGTAWLASGGYVLIKPKGGIFYPPDNASPELLYVGITITAPGSIKMGDVNLDSLRNSGDASLMLLYLAKTVDLSYSQMLYFDINSDGKLSSGDASHLLYCMSGEIPWS
ncbi:MAG: dockerin type I repeat-containing protein [Clostridia bacterium]